METTEQAAPQAPPAQLAETAAPAAAPASLNDFDSLLKQFESETKPAAPQPTATESVPDAPAANALTAPTNPAQTLDQAIAALNNDAAVRGTDEMRQAVNQLAGVVQNIQQQQMIDRDRADFEGVLAKAGKALEAQGLAVNEEEIQRWYLAEISLNPQIVAAFDRRNLSPADRSRFDREERKAQERLANSIKHRPDPEVTAERNAIVAAVTKGGSYKAPKERPIDYGSLSDAEYRAELRKLGIA